MKIQDPHKLAERLLEAANMEAGASSKVALAWFVALIILWQGSLEPLVLKLTVLYDKSRVSKEEEKKGYQVAGKIKELTAQSSDSDPQVVAANRRLIEIEKRKRDAEKSVTTQIKELKVAFSVPGFPNFDIPTRFASLVWCALLLGLVAYVAKTRSAVLTHVGKAARLLRDHSGGILYRPPVVVKLPWWTAPMPARNGLVVRVSEFRTLVGFPQSPVPTFIVAGALIIVCFLQLRVSLIASTVLLELGTRSEASVTLVPLIAVSALGALVTIVLSAFWFRQLAVPDQLDEEMNPNVLGRRNAILMTIALPLTALIVAGAAVTKPGLLTSWVRRLRYRRNKPRLVALNLGNGFYVNRRSKVIQYVTTEKIESRPREPSSGKGFMIGVRHPTARAPKERNFVPVSPLKVFDQSEAGFHLNKGVKGQAVELAASNAWRAARQNEACELLWIAILSDLHHSDVPNMRLYYRLVKYSLLCGEEYRLSRLLDAIAEAGKKNYFQQATQSWTAPTSRWRKRLMYMR